MHRRHVSLLECRRTHHPHFGSPASTGLGSLAGIAHGKQGAVRRDIQVRSVRRKRESLDGFVFGIGVGNAHQNDKAAIPPNTPQRTIGRVERQIADTGVGQHGPRFASANVQRFEVPVAIGVGGEKQRVGSRVVGKVRHAQPASTLQFQHLFHSTGGARNSHQLRHLAGVLHRGINLSAVSGHEMPRNRSQRLLGHVFVRRYRVLSNGSEVPGLEFFFPTNPGLPGFRQGQAIHLLELRRVVALAAFITLPPRHKLFGAVGEREIAHEARAVKVGICARTVVHGSALGNQAERVVERHLAVHHAAEHHLVVATLCAPDAAHLPGLGKSGHPLLVPTWGRGTWGGQVVVKQAFRMLGIHVHLAAKPLPEALVRAVGVVVERYVNGFVRGGDRQGLAFRQ